MVSTPENPGLMVHRFGEPLEAMQLEDCPTPSLAPGQVRVRMQLAAINPSDLITISGAYRSRTSLPFVAGFEGFGVIEAVAGDVSGLNVGTRVLPLGSAGAWQSRKVTEAKWCFAVDPNLSDEDAATSYINPMTAWLMLTEAADISASTRVVISAAASTIGRMLIRLLNARGVEPVAIVRSKASAASLGGSAIERLIVTDNGNDLSSQLRAAWNGAAPDLALDAVGGTTGEVMIDALAPGGHCLHYGLLSGQPLGRERPLRQDIRFELLALRDWVHRRTRPEIADALAKTARLVTDGTLASPIANIYPLTDYRTAFSENAQADRNGKILLNLADESTCR